MDPISIGLLLASLGASAAGGSMNANAGAKDYQAKLEAETAQAQQQTAEAAARNAVLGQYQDRNKGYIAQNQGVLGTEIGGFAKPAQEAQQSALTAGRQGAIRSAIDAGPVAASRLRDTDSPAVASAYAREMQDKMALSHSQGDAQGALSAFGDNWDRNALSVAGANRNIGTTNAISQNDMSTLPAAQDLAGFQTRKIIKQAPAANRTAGNLLTGLGTLGATVAGSGALKGASFFGGTAPAVPGLSLTGTGGLY